MTKKELMNLGITDEQADSVLDMLKDAYVPLTRFNEINEKMKSYKTQFEEKNREVETLSSKVEDVDNLKGEIQKLKDENAKAAGDHLAAISAMKKSNALDDYLREQKAKNVTAVKALLDMDKITFEDGKLAGHEDQITALKEKESSKFMFDTTAGYTPKGTQPGQASGGSASGGFVSFGDAIKNALNINK